MALEGRLLRTEYLSGPLTIADPQSLCVADAQADGARMFDIMASGLPPKVAPDK